MQKLISFTLEADFGFFRKPDTNAGINLSYNMLHKPALLGILGAIAGLKGYTTFGKLPEYYQEFESIKVAIEPRNHEMGNFRKMVIKYSNTVGYANNGSNYLTEEATLIKPSYCCYLLLDTDKPNQQKLYDNIRSGHSEFLPYFGKNEFPIWWDKDEVTEHDIQPFDPEKHASGGSFKVVSLLKMTQDISILDSIFKEEDDFGYVDDDEVEPFVYFERLPTCLEASDAALEKKKKARYSYDKPQKFIFTTAYLDAEKEYQDANFYLIEEGKTIYTF